MSRLFKKGLYYQDYKLSQEILKLETTLKARPGIKIKKTCTVLEPDEFCPYYTIEE